MPDQSQPSPAEISGNTPPHFTDPNILGPVALGGAGIDPEHHTGENKEKLGLTEQEERLVILASQGGTVEEVAPIMEMTPDEIGDLRDGVIDKLSVVNMAAAVNVCIRRQVIPIEVSPRQMNLTEREIKVLALINKGASSSQIASALNKKSDSSMKNISKKLFRKLGANGRTNSVRRAYETGVFSLD